MKMDNEVPTHLPRITRVELVDSRGKIYTNWKCENVVLSLQDDNRTLKVFIDSDEKFVLNQCVPAEDL